MPIFLSEGLIYLIPKVEGISEDIRKWTPTLLNNSYKIFAKMLNFRQQKILPKVIHVSKTGFMKDRSIVDNVFTFWETTTLAVKKETKLGSIVVGFEKAYDRVDWKILEGSMHRLGFTTTWIKGVSCLYRNAYSQVLLAGGIEPRFNITRFGSQGCPLAPFLFLLFAEVMHAF